MQDADDHASSQTEERGDRPEVKPDPDLVSYRDKAAKPDPEPESYERKAAPEPQARAKEPARR